jgi:transcriptional regulator with XRE-family HTH domain
MENNTALVIRSVRKSLGMSQVEFKDILEISQSALSKIESGVLELSAKQWMSLCLKFNLDPKSLLTGSVRYMQLELPLNLNSQLRVGHFKLPPSWAGQVHSTIRATYPLIQLIRKKLGPQYLKSLLSKIELDEDYLTILNHPISIYFTQYLVSALSQKGVLSNESALEIHQMVNIEDLAPQMQVFSVKQLIERMPIYFDRDSGYRLLENGNRNLYIQVRDSEHVLKAELEKNFKEFRANYNLGFFDRYYQYLFPGEKQLSLSMTENGWDIVSAS